LYYIDYSIWDSINIVDVCGHERIWTAFQSELTHINISNMAVAVACEHFRQPNSSESINSARIGARIIGQKNKKLESTTREKTLHYGDRIVSGTALCFGGKDVFYISLKQGTVFNAGFPLSSNNEERSESKFTRHIISQPKDPQFLWACQRDLLIIADSIAC
jgi:hypothetical protein